MKLDQYSHSTDRPDWREPHNGYRTAKPLFGSQQNVHQGSTLAEEELGRRHDVSSQLYPELQLSKGEYVIDAVRRHPIGVLSIWAVVVLVGVVTFALLPLYSLNRTGLATTLQISPDVLPSPAVMALPMLLITGLFAVGGFIATVVYNSNRFFLTNESVIQFIRTSLLSRDEQHINLANIEDASFRQKGILQTLLNYGTIRLSTEGEETTYKFYFVANPQQVVRDVNEAIENATGNAVRFRSAAHHPPQIVNDH